MRIVKGQFIGALPAIDVRRFIQRHRSLDFAAGALQEMFPEMSDEQVRVTWEALMSEGYIRFCNEWNAQSWYKTTTKGNALSHASAAKPISRKTAEKRLQEFMARVEEVNHNDEYAFKIGRVILFGSMLADSSSVGDVDLMIQLEPRLPDKAEFEKHEKQRIQLAYSNGRSFPTFVEELYWPTREIYLFLKAKSRVFSLHEIRELSLLERNEYKMLLGSAPDCNDHGHKRNMEDV